MLVEIDINGYATGVEWVAALHTEETTMQFGRVGYPPCHCEAVFHLDEIVCGVVKGTMLWIEAYKEHPMMMLSVQVSC